MISHICNNEAEGKAFESNIFNSLCKSYLHPSIILWRYNELIIIKGKIDKMNYRKSLDLGCGEGAVASSLFSRKLTAGIDIDKSDLLTASDKNAYDHLILSSATNLPFDDKFFNFIFSNCVIEHIEDIDSVISESSRCLKEGGLFLFTVPSVHFNEFLLACRISRIIGIRSLGKNYSRFINRHYNHFNIYTIDQWARKLSDHNLDIVDHSYYLSDSYFFFWEFFLIIGFIIKKARLAPLFKLLDSIKLVNKIRCWFLKSLVTHFINKDPQEGAGLLIIAQRRGE